jgi:hypothetical protein
MQLLVAQSDAHPPLEVASWIVTIVGFGLVILQLCFYWFGRLFPFWIHAIGKTVTVVDPERKDEVLLLEVAFRSRTRDTQPVREIILADGPNRWQMLWPWWYYKSYPATLPIRRFEPLKIDAHDTCDVVLTFRCDNLPYGGRTRLRVYRASRKRPLVGPRPPAVGGRRSSPPTIRYRTPWDPADTP